MDRIEAGERHEGEFDSLVQHLHTIYVNILIYQDIRI